MKKPTTSINLFSQKLFFLFLYLTSFNQIVVEGRTSEFNYDPYDAES